ncbi:MAG: hypothetical protein ACFE95_21775, partial [Candidatus Hodarchaeota archaeon]
TKGYSISAFEPLEVRFSKFFGGKKYNSSFDAGIEITWEITSTKQIEVSFEFDIRDYQPIQGEFTRTIEFSREINVGISNLTVRIEAEYLFHSMYIGGLEVYSASIFLPDSQGGLRHQFQEHDLSLIDFDFHVGILPSIDYQEYTMYVNAFFIKTPEIKFYQTGSQNLYDGLYVNITVGVNTIETYELIIDLFSENDYLLLNIRNTTSFVGSELNNYSILFFFTAETLVRKGFDKFVYGNISIINTNLYFQANITIPHFSFNKSNFNYTLPISTVSKVFDYSLDSNQDGKFDAIVVILTLKVPKSGEYGFSVGFYSQLHHYYEAYLGNVTLSKQYFITGVHNVTVYIPYYYFLSIFDKADEFDMKPEIKIITVPLFSNDDQGMFLISAQPTFLENKYDLDKFYLIQPLSIGLVKFIQRDTNIDGMADALDSIVTIVVHDILSYTLEIEIEVFWEQNSNLITKKTNYHPSSLGNIQSVISFTFSELFVNDNPLSHYKVKASVKIISFDGIQIDSYITPFNISFNTEMSIPVTESTTDTLEDGDRSGFLRILGLALMVLIITGLMGVLLILYRKLYKI